ncbi:MAG: hypothetical protein JG764_310 [Clostridiales bacterium]|jgi:multicomponent Na+:H+ antiporter subunit B|nr:hypothetical protein [Clostridiales bacterium]
MRIVSTLLLIFFTFIVFYAAAGLPDVGDPNSAPSTHVSPRYIEKAYEEIHSPNVVTAVLADYRGYDTLGETTVIFTAGIATVLILRAGHKKSDQGGKRE